VLLNYLGQYHSLCLEDLHWEPIPRCIKSNLDHYEYEKLAF